ncbi:MAG: DUF885 domain-containing protein [Colwellia sp.]|nr:DUF885 domain-containing protein [Colwellia sp.]MCW8866664.1 DUF885 domain-containing protein [Colwellia sp.]MCW9081482.1 DUF885 domain-containing protein [Colwellia sp.]
MRTKLSVITLAILLSACQPDPASDKSNNQSSANIEASKETQAKSESERINEWFAKKYEQQLQLSPMTLTFLGRKDQYDKIDVMTEAEEVRQLAMQKQSVEELKANFDYDKLNDEAKISYDIWVYQYEQAAEGQQYNSNGYIFTQMQGVQAFAAQFLISFHKVDTESDMLAYNKRISGISQAIADLLVRAQANAKVGVRPPKFAYEGVIEQAQGLITGAPFSAGEDSALWADAKRKVTALVEAKSIEQARADELLAETKQALLTKFLPTYQALVAWFEEDIVNTDEIATGVGKQPNGENYYNFRLKASTTTNLTADEIHQVGLAEVARITKEMIAIKDKVGFEGDLQEFFTFVKTDQQFFYPNTDEGRQGYITDTESYLAKINKQLPNFFGILPKADLVVKRVESFREQDGAAQHYYPGTPDGSRDGIYYAHLSDMTAMPKNEMEGIAYHEGNPGHHMQISIAQELTGVPQFRTQANFTAYAEGWGLYAELLAKEMGGYQNDFSNFGRLVNEIWRAVRLVVDTGLHSKGWTEAEAIAYFKENTPVSAEAITSEVRRYIVWPGQATAYKVGMLKILALRAKAEKELADKFDIKGFHDTVLGGGSVPLAILERRVDSWIAKMK